MTTSSISIDSINKTVNISTNVDGNEKTTQRPMTQTELDLLDKDMQIQLKSKLDELKMLQNLLNNPK